MDSLLLDLSMILVAAKLGGHLAIRLKQPAVLGELVFGIVLGNLHLLRGSPLIDTLAEIGVILLLFEVGLHSTLTEMAKVGFTSFVVAMLGVVIPFFLGWGVSQWLMPDQSMYVHLFLGATLTATSVGLTARVLEDLGRAKSKEAKIILGAAVIDDVLGLIILAAVSGMISSANIGAPFSYSILFWTTAKAVAFLGGALLIGGLTARRVLRVASHLQGNGVLLGLMLAICFLFSYGAHLSGLAPIVGAFAAGLILEEVHFREFYEAREQSIHALLSPLLSFLVPIFFVKMGSQVALESFTDFSILKIAAFITFAAIIGKQACSLGVFEKGVNRFAVGIGMIPRGEVGLIFANLGLGLYVKGERIVSEATFSSIVMMVIVTTLITPSLLSAAFSVNKR